MELVLPFVPVVLNLLMLQPFNRVPHVVTSPPVKLFWLLRHGCSFAPVVNRHVKLCLW